MMMTRMFDTMKRAQKYVCSKKRKRKKRKDGY
jgi:hypothetical protein